MSDAIKKLHDYLAESPSVIYPEDVLAYLPAIEAENAQLREQGERLFDKTLELGTKNAKLRDSLKALMIGTNVELCADRDAPQCQECSMALDERRCAMSDAMELLGIDMYGEPLGRE